jgi:hypothetical protein
MLRLLSSIEAPESYSVAAVAAKVGFAWTFAQVVSYCVGSALLAAVIVTARRRDDRASFALSIAAVLGVSPIVWSHYFALLLVPVAIFSPRFGVAWLLPIGLFAFPMTPGACSLWQLTMALGLAAATMALSAGLPRGRGIGAVQAGGVELPLIGVPGIRSTRRSG